MLKVLGRLVTASARTAGSKIAAHRFAIVIAVLAVVASVGATGFSVVTFARSGGGTGSDGGDPQAGGHNWWALGDYDGFCTDCHSGISDELGQSLALHGTQPALSSCSFCHTFVPGGHVATVPTCAACHSTQSTALTTDAHAGMSADVGEQPGQESNTCRACHTHIGVNLVTTPAPDLPLTIGP